jgi:regulator of chromosome condensation
MLISLSLQVFSWGCNDDGALGRNTTKDEDGLTSEKSETKPGLVEGLEGLRVVKICAGDSHSVVLTESGEVFGWGTFRVRQHSRVIFHY